MPTTDKPAPGGFRITRLKFLDEPWAGWRRSYWRCKRHGAYAFRDYQPFSLSNPIIGALKCGCRGHPLDGDIVEVSEQEGLRGILAQHEAAQAAKAAADCRLERVG